MKTNMKLCVSLDLESSKENLALVEKIKDFDIWLKVGFRTYLRDGKKFLEDLKSINPNFKIFLDLKLYDIPNTMADAAEDISNFGLVDMFNVHASAGKFAMQTVMNRIKDIPNRPLVLAVTALTSFDNDTFEAGLDGVVCSAFESINIKNNTNKEFITLCPGIRPFGEDSGDQKRVADINFSKENLVDFIVVGRPIYKNENPNDIVNKILQNI